MARQTMPSSDIHRRPAPMPPHLLHEALACFRAGRLLDTRRLLQTVLTIDKHHFMALQLLGVTEAQLGRPEAAIKLLEAALAINRSSPDVLNNLGMVLHQAGRNKAAVERYRAALAHAPDYAIAHNNLGIALSALGRNDEAFTAFQKALALKPDYPDALNNLAGEHFAATRYDEAATAFTKALTARPDYPEAALGLGSTLAALGRYVEALEQFEKTIALKPDLPGVELGLGAALNALRRYRDAIAPLERARALTPESADVELNLGIALSGQGRHDEALLHHQRALLLQPAFAAAEMHLGTALVSLRRHDEALEHLGRARDLRPDDPEIEMQLGLAFAAVQRHDEAIANFNRALTLRPDFSEAQVNLARSLRALDRHVDALALLEAAVVSNPSLAQAHDSLGLALAESGRIDEACRAFDNAISLDPRQPNFYLNRLNARRLAPDSPHRSAMASLDADRDAFTDDDRIALDFALAKALADSGNYQRAFDHLMRGNALKRRQIKYDEAAALMRFEHTRQVFTSELMQRLHGRGDSSGLPIFILGMPRSGSTLVEQILASHPKVFAGGERLDFRNAMRDTEIDSRSLQFPTAMSTVAPAQIRHLGESYLARLAAAATGQPERITDKMPANFRFAGLVHLALPNARIIHTCREPVDTCLSCFSIVFGGTQPFAYDLGELGRYYRGYAELMNHWRRVLPQGVMLDVQYEDLVTNFEVEAARILDHCGLDWYDGCLSFHTTNRPVRTSSMSQVRQPLYTSAIGRWRVSEDSLRPLLEGLGSGLLPRAGHAISAAE